MPVTVQGPDQKTYQFPDGTTKEAAVSYFKKNGIGAATSSQPKDELSDLIAKQPQAKESAISRFAGSAARAALPSTNLPDYAYPFEHPIDAAKNLPGVFKEMLQRQGQEGTEAVESFKAGNYGEAALHGAGYAIPLVGPQLVEGGEQLEQGDIAGGVGTTLGVAASIFAPELAEKGLSQVGKLREFARGQAQRFVGASPSAVTRPIVEKYTENVAKHAASEAEKNEAVANVNQKIEAKQAEKVSAHREKAASTIRENMESAHTEGRRAGIDRSLEEGSKELGTRIGELDKKLRAEGNEKYGAVRAKTANDPGVPIQPMLADLMESERSVPQGSDESIRQIHDLFKKFTDNPDQPTIGFDDLQGYSSEIGSKLAAGNLPGDVYQTLKTVKSKLDAAKTEIAERNGAGDLLKDADSFWSSYMGTFYDRPSAVAATHGKLGDIDPKFYADPFVKGKSGETAISNLKTLPTRHADEASAVADLASNLRKASAERKGMPKPTAPKSIPSAPGPAALKTRIPEAAPEAPTVEDITAGRRKEIEKAASARHPYLVGGAIISVLTAPFTGHIGYSLETMGGLAVAERILESPSAVEWLSSPTAGDLKAIEGLPEPAKANLRANLKSIIDQRSNGKPVNISPNLLRAAGVTAITSKPVQNRQEALDRLQDVQ